MRLAAAQLKDVTSLFFVTPLPPRDDLFLILASAGAEPGDLSEEHELDDASDVIQKNVNVKRDENCKDIPRKMPLPTWNTALTFAIGGDQPPPLPSFHEMSRRSMHCKQHELPANFGVLCHKPGRMSPGLMRSISPFQSRITRDWP